MSGSVQTSKSQYIWDEWSDHEESSEAPPKYDKVMTDKQSLLSNLEKVV